jgi:hypothetical protein
MAIDGTYKGTAKSMMGSADFEITIKTDGSTVTGRASAMGIDAEIQNGVLNGSDVNCQIEGNGPLGHMVLDIEANIDGDTLTGVAKAGRMKVKLEGTRV